MDPQEHGALVHGGELNMTDFAVTGKKRAGKGLFCAGIIRDALKAGKRVATNMQIDLVGMLGSYSRAQLIRLPDYPTAADMDSLGQGYEDDGIDEEKNGVIVLDEASKFFNSRSWGDRDRQPLLDWLVESGKRRWDVYYQMQGLAQVDKQLRETQIEYHIAVKRMDRWPIPFITPICGMMGFDVRFPKIHLGIIKQGCDVHALKVGNKWYKAKDLYNAYETEQRFYPRDHPKAVGIHTLLSPWYVKGRYLPPPPPFWVRFIANIRGKSWVPEVPQSLPKPSKHPLAIRLSQLPEAERIRHFNRLESLGAFELV